MSSRESPPGRVSFFGEQARWRRRTWRASAVCGLAALIVGAPLAVLITPAVVLVIGLALKTVPGNEGAVEDLVRWIDSVSDSAWFALPVLLLPGMTVLLAIWLALRARFQKAGIRALLSSLGVRPPRRDDAEEIQIGNVIEEMALASGCPVPAVFLLDTEVANAAAVGVSENESAIVVSRGLLDGLARDETQAVVGHLIGSVANGDLRILASWNAVFQSLGLVLLVLDAAFALSPSAARDSLRALRFLLGSSRDPEEAAAIEEILVARILELRADGLHGLSSDLQKPQPQTRVGRLVKRLPPLYVLLVPFLLLYVLSLLLRWQVWILRLLLVGPMVMGVWRSRRYLADALSVQLTRNPDALARALEKLSAAGELLSKARWAEPLFVVGASRGAWSQEMGGVVGSHPPLNERLQRIAAMGGVDLTEKAKQRWTPGELTLAGLLASPLLFTIASMFLLIAVVSMALATIPAIGLTLLGLKLVRLIL